MHFNRSPSTVKLFELTDSGAVPVAPPEAIINDMLPPELRKVFFTDSDHAMSFIQEESVTARRKHVWEAIRSLLGLNVIEKALSHVKRTTSELNKDAKKIGSDEGLTEIAAELDQIDKNISDIEVKRDDAKLQFNALSQSLSEIDKEIEGFLFSGDREALNLELKQTMLQLEQVDKQRTEVSKAHSDLFGSLSLLRDLLAPVLQKSRTKLKELRDQGAFPIIPIHILEELLRCSTCACGESLASHTRDGKHRTEHLQYLIEKSREPDALQKILADLYYALLDLHPKEIIDNEHWTVKQAGIVKHRVELEELHDKRGQILKSLEAQTVRIPDTNVQKLRAQKQDRIKQRDQFNADRVKCETQLDILNQERRSLVATRTNLLTKQKKLTRTLTDLEVTRDIEQILENSYNLITNEELTKVSELMNKLFFEMIRAKPGQGAIIQRVEVSEDFDIQVYGPNDLPLNLNSIGTRIRGVLSLTFILVLTKVSEVETPNVIDTPLGMMDILIKRSVLETAIRESSQLILFLTSSESENCEDILDAHAGRVITLTNPSHYPERLVNPPPTEELKILQCQCGHHQECEICTRKTHIEI